MMFFPCRSRPTEWPSLVSRHRPPRPTPPTARVHPDLQVRSPECIDVDGSDAVERVRSTFEYHNPSSMANGTTVCDRHHELAYYSGGVRKTMMAGPPSCISPAAVLSTGDYVLFTIPGGADRNKPVCVRTKSPGERSGVVGHEPRPRCLAPLAGRGHPDV